MVARRSLKAKILVRIQVPQQSSLSPQFVLMSHLKGHCHENKAKEACGWRGFRAAFRPDESAVGQHQVGLYIVQGFGLGSDVPA